MQPRQSVRHDVELAATLEVGEDPPLEVVIRNISLGGAYVESPLSHPMGTRAQLTFKVPTLDDPVSTGAQVRWTSEGGLGLQFDGLRAREVWALNKYFEQLPPG